MDISCLRILSYYFFCSSWIQLHLKRHFSPIKFFQFIRHFHWLKIDYFCCINVLSFILFQQQINRTCNQRLIYQQFKSCLILTNPAKIIWICIHVFFHNFMNKHLSSFIRTRSIYRIITWKYMLKHKCIFNHIKDFFLCRNSILIFLVQSFQYCMCSLSKSKQFRNCSIIPIYILQFIHEWTFKIWFNWRKICWQFIVIKSWDRFNLIS